MPSFDIVSEVDSHELTNAIDIANRELKNRFDFKNVDASFTLEKFVVVLQAPSDFQVQQMLDIVRQHTQQDVLNVVKQKDGSVTVNTGVVHGPLDGHGTAFEFYRVDGKWKLIRQSEWIS